MTKDCLTPGTYYETGAGSNRIDGALNILTVRLVFPFDASFWLRGEAGLREPTKDQLSSELCEDDARKLYLYDQRAAERKRITDLIHDAMEPVGADCYRMMRAVDQVCNVTKVEDGIARAERLRLRRERNAP